MSEDEMNVVSINYFIVSACEAKRKYIITGMSLIWRNNFSPQ